MTQKLDIFILDLLFKSLDNAISLDYSHVGAGDLGALVRDSNYQVPTIFSAMVKINLGKKFGKNLGKTPYSQHFFTNTLKPLN